MQFVANIARSAPALLVAACFLSPSADAGASAQTSKFGAPATFISLPTGWTSRHGPLAGTANPSVSTWTFAASWQYRTDANGPVHQLRPDRILIDVILFRPRGFPTTNRYRPLIRQPLELAHADVVSTEEGMPKVAQYRFARSFGCQYDIDVRVDFARPNPTRLMLRAAQAALNKLSLPTWGRSC